MHHVVCNCFVRTGNLIVRIWWIDNVMHIKNVRFGWVSHFCFFFNERKEKPHTHTQLTSEINGEKVKEKKNNSNNTINGLNAFHFVEMVMQFSWNELKLLPLHSADSFDALRIQEKQNGAFLSFDNVFNSLPYLGLQSIDFNLIVMNCAYTNAIQITNMYSVAHWTLDILYISQTTVTMAALCALHNYLLNYLKRNKKINFVLRQLPRRFPFSVCTHKYTEVRTYVVRTHTEFMAIISSKFNFNCWLSRILSVKMLLSTKVYTFLFLLLLFILPINQTILNSMEMIIFKKYTLFYLLKSRMRRRRAGVDILIETLPAYLRSFDNTIGDIALRFTVWNSFDAVADIVT